MILEEPFKQFSFNFKGFKCIVAMYANRTSYSFLQKGMFKNHTYIIPSVIFTVDDAFLKCRMDFRFLGEIRNDSFLMILRYIKQRFPKIKKIKATIFESNERDFAQLLIKGFKPCINLNKCFLRENSWEPLKFIYNLNGIQ